MKNDNYSSIIKNTDRAVQRLLRIFYTGDSDTLYVSSAIFGDTYEISGSDAETITSALAVFIAILHETQLIEED